MSSTQRTRGDDVAHEQDPTHGGTAATVTVQPEHLPELMHEFCISISSEIADPADNFRSREDFEKIREALKRWEPLLERIGWGVSDKPVSVTMPREEIAEIARCLIETGADKVQGIEAVDEIKSRLNKLYAGLSIAEQLDADTTREEA